MTTIFNAIFLQAGSATSVFTQMWPLIMIIFVFYFFIIRPQSKKAKEQNTFIDELEKGDDIVTTSGIYGRVSKIEGDVVTLQVDTKTFIRVTRTAVSKDLTEASNSTEKTKA